jgi:fructosamine-3-kinase
LSLGIRLTDVVVAHPLLDKAVVREIERAASAHRGRPWTVCGFTDLDDRAYHPCGVIHGPAFSVFAKLGVLAEAAEQFAAELRGLNLLSQQAAVATPTPVGAGVITVAEVAVLLLEAIPERPAETRSVADWQRIGHVLAGLHQVHHARFGLDQFNGFFGPLPQDNRPVASHRWADFYAQRRLLPQLRRAVDSGHLPPALAADVQRLIGRLPALCGPEPYPSLLHGDAQQNNFVSTPTSAVLIDPAPYFGHPEIDLAMLDYFQPVPAAVFDAYRDVTAIDPGFAQRRELWRLSGYLAVVAVDGANPFGQRILTRLADAVRHYR